LTRVSKLLDGKGCHIRVRIRRNTRHVVVLNRHALVTARCGHSGAVGEATLICTLQVRILRSNRISFQVSRCGTVVVLVDRP
jgi:hypothetical protein